MAVLTQAEGTVLLGNNGALPLDGGEDWYAAQMVYPFGHGLSYYAAHPMRFFSAKCPVHRNAVPVSCSGKGKPMKIIEYEDKYRDDMIFMVLEAKNALGRVPHLNEDLLDIRKYYFSHGDMFWLAINDNDRVIGCVGYNKHTSDTAKLHRLYVKCDLKRQRIGTELLKAAERHMSAKGYQYAIVHLGGKEYFESRQFYPKHGYTEYEPGYMRKEL